MFLTIYMVCWLVCSIILTRRFAGRHRPNVIDAAMACTFSLVWWAILIALIVKYLASFTVKGKQQ